MADSSPPPALPEDEQRAAEALLTRAFGEPTVVQAVELLWDRGHVSRLQLASGRAVILKRQRKQGPGSSQLFGDELAALEYLNAMPVPVAPRLLGADAEAGLLLIEDLGDGTTLADVLMAAGRERVQAELIAYAQALGSLHAWSMGHAGEAAGLRARHGPGDEAAPRWRDAVQRGKEPFLAAAAALGVASDGVAEEVDQVHRIIIGTSYLGLVHGDPCPDNVLLIDGICRIVDFEHAGWGPVAYDAAYLLAPFPSCWCFARLPAEVAGPAVAAYRARLEIAGIELGPDWESTTTAVLAAAFLGRGQVFAEALDRDHEWGTTTMRPRLLAWLGSFTGRAGDCTLPRLQATAAAMYARLTERWAGIRIPDYPSLAQAGSALAQLPDGWQPQP
ncbi:MAG TPA: aminoglycoside phosphotransferase family protein [Streptosporangiaceae bacterium]